MEATILLALEEALQEQLRTLLKKEDLMRKKEVEITGEDVREGMIAVISLKMPDPKFSQTKDKLVSSEARPAVETLINDYFMDFSACKQTTSKRDSWKST